MNSIHVFLVGNHAAGKSTLFQALTGQVTPTNTYATGSFRHNSRDVVLEEFPGIYSLTAATPAEAWVRQQLFARNPDLVIDVVDATNLERDLYLTVQLIEMGLPLLVALSKEDAARAQGLSIATSALSARLRGVPVVSMQAADAGDHPLKQAIAAHFANGSANR